MPGTLTTQGTATRRRILVAAAGLISRRGVAGTTLDDVRAATSTSKSQLYHYFSGKPGLVRAVIEYQRDVVLAEQRLAEEPLDSLAALHRWRYRTIATHRRHGFTRPCPLGRLAAEIAPDDAARPALDAAFREWRDQLAGGLRRMLAEGRLRPEADPAGLATALLAAVQGGLLLASVSRDARPLQSALDVAISQVAALATPEGAGSAGGPGVAAGTRGRALIERTHVPNEPKAGAMSQPASPAYGLPALGTVPLGPDEPELFTDAMERIIRRLGQPGDRQPGAGPASPWPAPGQAT